MASKNVETHRAAHEAWNRRDFDGAVSAMVENMTYTDHPRGLTLKSRQEFREWIAEWAQAFSDGKIIDARYADAGDTVVAQFLAQGTNDGSFGPFPATGREVTFPLCEVLYFDEEGRVVRGEAYYDQLSLLVQLGHVEAPAPATV